MNIVMAAALLVIVFAGPKQGGIDTVVVDDMKVCEELATEISNLQNHYGYGSYLRAFCISVPSSDSPSE